MLDAMGCGSWCAVDDAAGGVWLRADDALSSFELRPPRASPQRVTRVLTRPRERDAPHEALAMVYSAALPLRIDGRLVSLGTGEVRWADPEAIVCGHGRP